jgi:hypothetical protein
MISDLAGSVNSPWNNDEQANVNCEVCDLAQRVLT